MNKLSEQLKQDHECGDFGRALEGYSERAKRLEEECDIYYHELRRVYWLLDEDEKENLKPILGI